MPARATAATALAVALVTSIACAASEPAPTGAPRDAELERLRAELEGQERRLEALRARVEALAGGAPAEEDPGEREARVGELRLGLFFIETADRAYRLELHGRIHMDGRLLLERGHDDFDNTAQVRRARIEFHVLLHERVELDLGFEGGRTGDADVRNAFIDYELCEALQLRLGQMLLPFSGVRLTSSNHLNHPERPVLVASIVKQRDIGAMLHGELLGGALRYAVGGFGGEGENVKVDTDDDFDLACRLQLEAAGLVRAHVNYMYTPTNREQRGPADLATVGDEFTEFLDYDAGNRRLGRRHRAGGGAKLMWGPLELKGEVDLDYHEDVVAPGGRKADLLNWAWFVDAMWVVTGEEIRQTQTGGRVAPRAPLLDPESGALGAGAVAIAARFEDLKADPATVPGGFAVGADRLRAATGTLHWYLFETVRLSASYTWSHFDDGVYDSEGHRHRDEHALLVRAGLFF